MLLSFVKVEQLILILVLPDSFDFDLSMMKDLPDLPDCFVIQTHGTRPGNASHQRWHHQEAATSQTED